MNATFPANLRLLLAHKQKTSARVRFLRFPHGLCAFTALPAHSTVLPDAPESRVEMHPKVYLSNAESKLGLAPDSLVLEAEFNAFVATPMATVATPPTTADSPIQVRLATFTSIDPPFDAAERLGGRFVAITEARGCDPAELELLRLAYGVLMG
jgi:hypothetical protein